jgi:ATP-dependent helicase/nuclease subunit B
VVTAETNGRGVMLTHLSANCNELLVAAGAEFLAEQKDFPGVLIISRNKLAADELVYRGSHLPLHGIRRLSIEQLSQELARKRLAEEGRRTGTGLALDAITRRSINVLARSNSLGYFGSVADTPRFSGAVLRTLRELRLEGIDVSSLVRAGESAGDLGILLDQYGRELEDYELSDFPYRVRVAISVVKEGRHSFCGLPLMLLCPDLACAAHCELLKMLVAKSPAVLGLSLEDEQNGIEGVLGVKAVPVQRVARTCLEHAQESLFSLQPSPARPKDESFDTFSASGEALECVEIVRRIGEMVERGIRFDQIAVLLRSPERYQSVLEEALERSRIPAWFAHGCRRPLASGRAFLALLECAREGYTASRFLEYLSLGQARRRDAGSEQTAPLVAPALWERLIVDASVIGGAERWRIRLHGLLESLTAKRAALDEESERDNLDKHIGALKGLIEFALPLITLLQDLPVRASWGDWLDHLHHLASETLENSDPLSEVLAEIEPLRGIEDVSVDDVLTLLGDRLRSLRQPPPSARRYGRVFIGEAMDAFGMTFDAVFAPGLSEGTFPRPISEDPLFLSDVRKRVSPSLRIPRDDEERNLLRAILAAARKVCVCSYPRMDLLTGRAKVPSLYFFEAARAAYGPIRDVRQMETDARAGAETRASWPAPKEPIDAIDAAEFDLATLRPALLRATAPGLGAYLTRVEGPLANALRSRWLRWNEKEWKWADGIVDVDRDTQIVLDQYSLRAKAYSPSALQEFASCPYRFALKVIHGLRPAERPEMIQRMDPLMRGQLFHRAAYETIRHMMSAGLLPVNEGNLTACLRILDEVVGQTSTEFASQYSPALPAIWDHEVAMIKADLRGWLQSMTADQDWQPIAGELSFGRPLDESHNAESVENPLKALGDCIFVGSMDLIERNAAGQYRVTDYKTGRLAYPQPKVVGGGSCLQPLIYSLAAEVMLGKPVAGGRLHYATMRGMYKEIFIALNESNKRSLLKVLDGIDSSIRTGFLPAAPKEGACRHCEYLSVCGPYEEDRTKRKSPAALKILSEIRASR